MAKIFTSFKSLIIENISFNLKDRISAFSELGIFINEFFEAPDNSSFVKLDAAINLSFNRNAWFTRKMCIAALEGVSELLEEEKLKSWTNIYASSLSQLSNKTIGVVAAGNIPLVAFHDVLSVLIAGHKLKLKLSGDDKELLPVLLEELIKIDERFSMRIEFVEQKLMDYHAVIATGSNNTSRYFEFYFKSVPHIIRKNRTSVAVIDGNESDEEIGQLSKDIFCYFGLGCRNVSKIYAPKEYDFDKLFQAFHKFGWLMESNRYMNNYNLQQDAIPDE